MDTKSKIVLTSAALLFLFGVSLLYYEFTLSKHRSLDQAEALIERLSTKEEEQRCLNDIKQQYTFKDELSLRVEGKTNTYLYKGTAKQVLLHLNGKNSYGGYTGPKEWSCYYTVKDNKVHLVYSHDY